jgi:hypothetical protein
MNLDYPHDIHDPFATTDPGNLAKYRAWAHRALDTLIDFRLAWEADDSAVDAPHFGGPSNNPQSDERARELYSNVLTFANRIYGRKACERNAELFEEGDLPGMRAALRTVILKLQGAWPGAPIPLSDFVVKRAILPRDVENALIELDRGHTPDLFLKVSGRRESDLIKERCRFAGALWSLRLQVVGEVDFTAQIVAAFNLGNDGAKTVQRWKIALENPVVYAKKLGYGSDTHVTNLIRRANLIVDGEPTDNFTWEMVNGVFGEVYPLLNSLEAIGALFQSLRRKTQ